MKKTLAALALSLSLVGCATFQNPITLNQIGGMESAYGLALSAAVAYRSLPLCKTGTVATATSVCAQRSIVVKLQNASRSADIAIHAAVVFVRDNPTLNANAVIGQAQLALAGLQAIEQTYNIK